MTANKGNGFVAHAFDHWTTAHLEQAIEGEQKSLTTAHLEQKLPVSSTTQSQGQGTSGGAPNSESGKSGSSNQG